MYMSHRKRLNFSKLTMKIEKKIEGIQLVKFS